MAKDMRKKIVPASSPEEQENRNIGLACALAERQLRDGSASSQLIVTYVKRGSEKERLDNEKAREEIKLLKAKTDSIARAASMEVEVLEAMKAFRGYAGVEEDGEEEEYY